MTTPTDSPKPKWLPEAGSLWLSGVHDGNLFGLIVHDEKRLELQVASLSLGKISLIVPKLVQLRATDFCQGNTILYLRYFRGAELPLEPISKFAGRPENDAEVQAEFERARSAGLNLIWLESSYGCSLAALTRAQPDEIELWPSQAPSGP